MLIESTVQLVSQFCFASSPLLVLVKNLALSLLVLHLLSLLRKSLALLILVRGPGNWPSGVIKLLFSHLCENVHVRNRVIRLDSVGLVYLLLKPRS